MNTLVGGVPFPFVAVALRAALNANGDEPPSPEPCWPNGNGDEAPLPPAEFVEPACPKTPLFPNVKVLGAVAGEPNALETGAVDEAAEVPNIGAVGVGAGVWPKALTVGVDAWPKLKAFGGSAFGISTASGAPVVGLPAAPRMENPVAGALFASALGAPNPLNAFDEFATPAALLDVFPKLNPNLAPESDVEAVGAGASTLGAVDVPAPKAFVELKEKELGATEFDANGFEPVVVLEVG